MLRAIARVEGGLLYPTETSAEPILVGSAAWYEWLEHHNAFRFADRVSEFSAHKSETDPGDLGWQAFGTRHGQRTHVQFGPSHALTLELLQAAAQVLAGEHASVEPPEVGQAAFAASLHQGSQTAAPVGSPSSLIRAKLYRPCSGSDVISRPHLLERLTAGLSGKVTLLSAPAGFGKTTLLAEWLHTLNRQVAWLSLDASDDALPLFVQALTAALQSVWSDAFLPTASLPSSLQFPPLAEVATLFLNDLADVHDDLVLVLDDYHFIHNRDVHRLLELLIDQLPPQVHLVLSARFDPPLPLVRWSASGQLNELRTADLRFTLAETHAFLARLLGNTLANETAVALGKHAEGWIAVLRLAALSLRSTADRAAFLDRLQHAPDRSVSQYLLEEILAQQAPLVQEVVLRSSLLEQFCAEVCVALLGDETSHAEVQATLNWLKGTNLFLVPLDEHQGWYRLHHLFQDLLQQRLRKRSSTEELAELHRRASAWYAGQGLLDEAVHHALAAGDASGAARLVEAHVLLAFDQDQWWPMERWLRLLPEEQVQANPGLLVARAWVSWIRGQLQDMPPLLRAAERLIATSSGELPDPSGIASQLLHALIATLWSCVQFYTGQVQPCLHSALSALERLSPEEEYVASCALVMLAQARQAAGQEEVALAELHQALRAQPARPAITVRLLFAQGDIYLAAGKLPQLEHTARHILTLAREADLAVTQNWVQWALGVVSYEWNQLDAAVYHFSAVLVDRHRAHTWTVREAMYGLALAYQAQGLGIRAHETTEALLDWVQGSTTCQSS